MRHIEDISALIRVLRQNDTFHALVIESPPGWAKSSTVEKALSEANIQFVSLGSYSTPLALYNSLCENPKALLVLDDCAGLFGEATSMSILKAACWASAGSGGGRRVSWSSSSERVLKPEFVFNGKIILLTNSVPMGKETQALLSRTLYLRLAFEVSEVKCMLIEAASSSDYFPDRGLAENVVHFLVSNDQKYDLRKLNLRTLKMGYEIARSNPSAWRDLLHRLLPATTQTSPQDVLRSLSISDLPVEEQAREFAMATGLSRRTFYYYRQGKVPLKDEPKSAEDFENTSSANCTTVQSILTTSAPGPLALPDDCQA